MTEISIDAVIARWTNTETRPKLWKGNLIGGFGTPDDPICRCAQGDVLHFAGWSDDDLRTVDQAKADAAVAKMLGISIAHSILLRQVNDSADGCPEDVLRAPEKILGPNAPALLAFWRHLDRMTEEDWRAFFQRARAARAAWDAWDARAARAAWDAWDARAARAARDARAAWAAWDAWDARDARAAWDAWDARDARDATGCAGTEIQFPDKMREAREDFFFLPLFGFANPEAVLEADRKATAPKE